LTLYKVFYILSAVAQCNGISSATLRPAGYFPVKSSSRKPNPVYGGCSVVNYVIRGWLSDFLYRGKPLAAPTRRKHLGNLQFMLDRAGPMRRRDVPTAKLLMEWLAIPKPPLDDEPPNYFVMEDGVQRRKLRRYKFNGGWRLQDRKGGAIDEWPEDLARQRVSG
jgi:hypothetical protein